jgi:catechol 2,3-dioxygenase-like lactoylglutathione lyase family enzyme
MNRPLIRQLAHVCIFARDLTETETFYRDVLGVTKVFTFLRGDTAIGFYLGLSERSHIEVFQGDANPFSPRDPINHICLETEDLEALVAHVRQQGVEVSAPKLGVDATWQAWIVDPNGVKVELFQYTPESLQFSRRGQVCQADWY